ncbi:MAG: hypothetical protein APF82_02040 [Sphingomonadales bacterium BRH_c42]|nr:MAG: hypothetical protein APF82_02040 [Sphingomonadales bacterium BRH_c42]
MRRSLVLTNEAARHPFLASLPPHVRQSPPDHEAQNAWRLSRDDVRGVVTTYFAVFAAALVFIA